MAGLSKIILEQIVKLILEHKRPQKVVIFGSRARGDFKKSSDVDIAVFGKGWTGRDINIIKNRLDELVKTPLKIDILNFYSIKKDKLKKNILQEGKVIYGH